MKNTNFIKYKMSLHLRKNINGKNSWQFHGAQTAITT